MNFEVEQFVTNPPFAENAFFIIDKANKAFIVVDPGDGAADKAKQLINKGFELERILITHVHIDHTWDLLKLSKLAPDAKICLHTDEVPMIENYGIFSQMIGIYDADPLPDLTKAVYLSNADTFIFSDKKFHVLQVPGHTKGHLAFYCGDAELKINQPSVPLDKGDKANGSDDKSVPLDKGDKAEGAGGFILSAEPSDADGICFVGDLIFEEGVGRTDFPGGSWDELTNSIKNKIYKLPDKTILYNGHGNPTTVKHEKSHNSFVRE